MTTLPEHFIPFAEQLANTSGEVIRRFFRQPVITQEKADLSPVTAADMEAEKGSARCFLYYHKPKQLIRILAETCKLFLRG